jgi:hypothetical protein
MNYSTNSGAAGKYDLPSRVRAIIDGGAEWCVLGYQSAYAARKSVCFWLVLRGWSFHDAYHYLISDSTRPGSYLWDDPKGVLGHDGRVKRLMEDWKAAEEFRDRHLAMRRADVLAVCGELRVLCQAWPWKGTAGRTDRAVLAVALAFAESSGSLSVRLAERAVSERANISSTTARTSLARLTEARWIRPDGNDQRGRTQGRLYRLNRHQRLPQGDVLHNRPNFEYSSYPNSKFGQLRNKLTPMEIATFGSSRAAGGFGKAGIDVLAAVMLAEMPLSPAEVARRAGVHRSTAGRQLLALQRFGLVCEDGGKWARGEADPFTLDIGTHRVKDRAEFHERERDRFHRRTGFKPRPAPEWREECVLCGGEGPLTSGDMCPRCARDYGGTEGLADAA